MAQYRGRTNFAVLRSLATLTLILAAQIASVHAQDCVVLLHGLARTSKSMNEMGHSLEAAGYRVANIDYPSREKPVEELSSLAVLDGVSACALGAGEKIHFVTHSMGGILVRYFLEHDSIDAIGNVVMLAPPNGGSEVVDNLKNVPGFRLVNGPAAVQLGTTPDSIIASLGPVNVPVGVIAGNRTFNPLLSQYLPNPDDGKVSVERTKVQGMADFIEIEATHPFIMKNREAIDQTITFLRRGRFNHETP